MGSAPWAAWGRFQELGESLRVQLGAQRGSCFPQGGLLPSGRASSRRLTVGSAAQRILGFCFLKIWPWETAPRSGLEGH